MRKYVKIFQQAEPAIFTIHIDQVDVFTDFDFIEPVVLSELNSIRKLKTVDFSSTENHLPNNLLSIARKIVKTSRKDDKTLCEFLNCLLKMCCLYG